MEGGGIVTLALLLAFGLPFALLKLAFKLLVMLPWGLFTKSGPREAALQEAAHGAALLVLPVLVLLRHGGALPSWSAFVALVLMVIGGFWLFNGAKFSVGWRDPKLLARATLKIVLAVFLFRAIDQRQWWIDPAVDAVGDGLLSLLGWFLLVTGTTKLFLVLRGLPAGVQVNPGMSYGAAPIANPSDAAKGLKK
ncbi:MAG TPA: hypothetical protein VKH13_16725 [Steroidobacteraceae bacterium]|nr:hypothetical protein [Steroidobacteraceae bacterium]